MKIPASVKLIAIWTAVSFAIVAIYGLTAPVGELDKTISEPARDFAGKSTPTTR